MNDLDSFLNEHDNEAAKNIWIELGINVAMTATFKIIEIVAKKAKVLFEELITKTLDDIEFPKYDYPDPPKVDEPDVPKGDGDIDTPKGDEDIDIPKGDGDADIPKQDGDGSSSNGGNDDASGGTGTSDSGGGSEPGGNIEDFLDEDSMAAWWLKLKEIYGEDIAAEIAEHGSKAYEYAKTYDDFADAVNEVGNADDVLRLLDVYPDEARELLEVMILYEDEAIELISKYGDDAFEKMKEGLNVDEIEELLGGGKSLFARNIDTVLKEYNITLDEFNSLRVKDVSMLTDEQIATLKAVRESIPMPDSSTVLQKVIPYGDIAKYLDGTYTKVGGFISRADDAIHLNNYYDIYYSFRLDYPGSVYNPIKDESLAVIRYATNDTSNIVIPYKKEFGGTTTGEPPFTGNGFTKALNGQIIPEYKCDELTMIKNGAQLIEIDKNGSQNIIAIFDEDFGRFVRVD